jgi:23S rRNA (cytidine1920-2'-O)/16S rRNA (cytidine1409-2'-O)-methyltransferase
MRARLDTELVERGLVSSREKAKRLILAGAVRVDGQLARKPSDRVDPAGQIEITAAEKYVSRGGHKLEAALEAFQIRCDGAVCVDIGASTGGFTDCLLQRGARRVHAVDVGKGQLDWKLRQDPRVTPWEGVNARSLAVVGATSRSRRRRSRDREVAPTIPMVDIATVDVSFISLKKILPAVTGLLKSGGQIVALIKPQFEAGRKFVKRGGVVRDSAVHERVKTEIETFATETLGLRMLGLIESPLLGPAGNKEFLIGLKKP